MTRESAENILESLIKGTPTEDVTLLVSMYTPTRETYPNAWTDTLRREIGLTRSLLNLLDEGDGPMLAFVYAHELGHLIMEHKGNVVAKYAENYGQELLADKFAITHMINAGFDPQGAIDFIKKLCKIVPDLEENSEQIAYPRPSERIALIQQHISRRKKMG